MSLIAGRNESLPAAFRKSLLFTSAGDYGAVPLWLKGRRDFDLWITCYGKDSRYYKRVADYYNNRKGTKFQNLHYAYHRWPQIFSRYEAVLVMDDDIIIDGTAIGRLFDIRRQYDLWLLQPSFDPRGKISHTITRATPFYFLRFTNFVEMTCPLFRRDKLDAFMRVFDPQLPGYGTDWWFVESLGCGIEGKVAVVDAVSCVNPHDATKGHVREIDRFHESLADRKRIWGAVKARYSIGTNENEFRDYGSVLAIGSARDLGHSIKLCFVYVYVLLTRQPVMRCVRLWNRVVCNRRS